MSRGTRAPTFHLCLRTFEGDFDYGDDPARISKIDFDSGDDPARTFDKISARSCKKPKAKAKKNKTFFERLGKGKGKGGGKD